MVKLKLPSIVLSISLGASLLAPVSASAQEPTQQLDKLGIQLKSAQENRRDLSKGFKRSALSDAPSQEGLNVTDYRVTTKSVYFGWSRSNETPTTTYQILLDGDIVDTVSSSYNYNGNEYAIEKTLTPGTEYQVTIKVLDNGVLTGEEVSFKFTTIEGVNPNAEVITLKDANLAQFIKEQLEIEDRDLYKTDFAYITKLEAFNREITSIEGLEYAVNLEYLDLMDNSIENISSLSGLQKLSFIDLSGNPIKSIDVLKTLPALEYVYFFETPLNFSNGSAAREIADELESEDVIFGYSLIAINQKIMSDKMMAIDYTSYTDEKADSYLLSYASREDKEAINVETTSTQLVLTDLKPNSFYIAFLVSYNKNGEQIEVLPMYFTTSASPKVNGWVQLGSNWYFYNSSTAQLAKGWVPWAGTWYYMDPTSGLMQTGWVKDGGKWYFLNPTGVMATGWVNSNGVWYYMTSSGAMQTGWVNVGNAWYYMNASGAMITGWVNDGRDWYYMSSSGAMQTGWLLTGGKWYYLKSSGAMQTGWAYISGKRYYFDGNGVLK